MALQEDPTKTFGSTSYFKNKDDQRKAVNETRQTERQKRIATQLLRRNMKKSMRAGGDGGNFMQAAKLGKLDIFGSNGLGEEAGAAMARARYDVDKNFQAAAKAKALEESKTGNAGQTPAINTGATTPTGSTPQTGVVPPANATPPPPVSGQATTQTADSKSVLTRPDWADEVANDRTFKDVDFNSPSDLARFQGKTRAEAYDMLRKDQAASFMSRASEKGEEMKAQEVAQQEAAAEAQAKKEKGILDKEIGKRIRSALKDAGMNTRVNYDGQATDWFDRATTDSYKSASETARMINNLANNLSDENFKLMGTTKEKFLQNAAKIEAQSARFEIPNVDYYSMSFDEKVADHKKRSDAYDRGELSKVPEQIPYKYFMNDKGEIKIDDRSHYVSKGYEVYQQLKSQSENPNSRFIAKTRNLVLAEDKAKQQRLDKLALDREQYQQQRIRDQQAKEAASTMFGTGS